MHLALLTLTLTLALAPHLAPASGPHPTADPILSARPDLVETFLTTPVEPVGGYLFSGDAFPALRWRDPLLVQALWSAPPPPLAVTWFDADGTTVDAPANPPARYAALVTAQLPDGTLFRRGLTLFYFPKAGGLAEWDTFPLLLREQPAFGLPDEIWRGQEHLLLDFARQAAFHHLLREPDGAVLAAGLADARRELASSGTTSVLTPTQRHRQHHLKIRTSSLPDPPTPLDRPRPAPTPAPTLRAGSPAEADLDDALPAALDGLAQEWLALEGLPFTILVARRGVIVFHSAYGERHGQPVDLDTVYPLFSISKSVTGIMVALFLDAGRLQLDEALERLLPDFTNRSGDPLTVRSCLMHASGLTGHGTWGGIKNPYLDNVIANAIALGQLPPGDHYSGTAYDLVGTAMQQLTAKTANQLFADHLFSPLDFQGARVDDLGAGIHLRAIDLAKLGQLMLNGGSYGDSQFFSSQARDAILPVRYADHFPGEAQADRADYGLGIRWAHEPHPRAGQGDIPTDAVIPGPRTIGHGALSGSIYRVDLDDDLIIAVGRFESGAQHSHYLRQLLLLLEDHRID